MAPSASVHGLRPLSEGDALAWLQAQGTITITGIELGRRWNWHRNEVGRQLQSWAASGAIRRNGRTISALSAPPKSAKVQSVQVQKTAPVQPVQTAKVQRSSLFSKFLSGLMILAALCIIGALIYINYMSWSALSESAPNVIALRVLSVVIDALAIILPAAAKSAKWRNAILCWVMWLVCILMIAWTAVGFAFGNFGEVAEGRRATIERKDIIDDRLKRARAELVKTDDLRRQCETDGPCPLAKDKKGRLAEVVRLTAVAKGLKADIGKDEILLAGLPAIVAADPQIAGGVKAIKRLAGYSIDLADASTGRDVVFALVLVLLPSGLIRGAISLVRD